RGRRLDELRNEPARRPSSAGHLRGTNSEGRKARRSAGPTGDRVRDSSQSQSRQGARRDHTDWNSAPRRRGDRMTRREFISLLGSAAAVWPVVTRAQQPDRMRRIGVFMHFASGDAEGQARIGAFLQGLQELGWAIGSNVQIDYRWSAGDPERGRRDAAELLALAPDVILATGVATLGPLHQGDRTE